jgi:hypothetical protein
VTPERIKRYAAEIANMFLEDNIHQCADDCTGCRDFADDVSKILTRLVTEFAQEIIEKEQAEEKKP